MGRSKPRALVDIEYEKAAQAYLRSLPLEHFMEATPQATQREITLASFALVRAVLAAFQFFNELLVQYPFGRPPTIRQVVPENMVVLHPEPIKAMTSFNLPLQPVGPFWVLEYVSKNSTRKDYEENFTRYEQQLKVPHYLIFYPDNQELTLYHLTRRGYRAVKPNEQGRYSIAEVDMEAALLDGWVRFWFRGNLLPLPAELQSELDATRKLLGAERQRADDERGRADREHERADREQAARLALEQELAHLRAQFGLPPGAPQ
jgi:hypothetical protein